MKKDGYVNKNEDPRMKERGCGEGRKKSDVRTEKILKGKGTRKGDHVKKDGNVKKDESARKIEDV